MGLVKGEIEAGLTVRLSVSTKSSSEMFWLRILGKDDAEILTLTVPLRSLMVSNVDKASVGVVPKLLPRVIDSSPL